MKTVLFKIIVFVFFLFIADVAVGYVCKRLFERSNDVPTLKLKHTINSTNEDILIMGSSRAECHLASVIVSKTTGMSVYNCGIGGADLQMTLIQLNQALKRYKPKLIVLEASPNIFFQKEAANRLKLLLPFYKEDTMIYNSLIRSDRYTKLKLLSSTYPYNSTIGASLRGVFKENHDTLKGFLPLFGNIDVAHEIAYANSFYNKPVLPEDKLGQLKDILAMCEKNNIKTIVVSTPVFYMNTNYRMMLEQLKALCISYKGIIFFDYTRYAKTFGVQKYFYDNSHLNDVGAVMFSQDFAEVIRSVASNEQYLASHGQDKAVHTK